MKPKNWEELHKELSEINWFAHVGDTNNRIKRKVEYVDSWEKARGWAEADISWWCLNEASNVLSLFLSTAHKMEYRKLNDHIKMISEPRDKLLEQSVVPSIPEDYRSTKMIGLIRSHLNVAYLECIYSPLVDVHLVRDLVKWYLFGRFPCGWKVEDEKSFPARAVTVVF